MKKTPPDAKLYLLLAAFFLALPAISSLYSGATGKFLVSTDQARGGPFESSVVYVVEHDLFRAYGFIINKPLSEEEIAKLNLPTDNPAIPLYYGGPVLYPDFPFIAGIRKNGEKIGFFPDLKNTDMSAPVTLADLDELRDLYSAQAYFGYAGWAPMQLNFEIMRGGWTVVPGDNDLIFNTPPDEIYDEAVRRAEGKIKDPFL